MRKLFFIITLVFFNVITANASHIAGGELYYKFISQDGNSKTYEITMRLTRDCHSEGQILQTEQVRVAIYDAISKKLVDSIYLNKQFSGTPPSISANPEDHPCISNFGGNCVQIGIFKAVKTLPNNDAGYILTWTRYSRMNLMNAQNPSGAIYTTQIPGNLSIGSNGINNSPKFVDKDTAVVCYNSKFELPFGAIDDDGDSLSYEFCNAYNGGNEPDPNPYPAKFKTLTLNNIIYNENYSGTQPLGANAFINPTTGLIYGRSPATAGPYVICVCVTEWRNNKPINIHRKDFILTVANCILPTADLKQPGYINCKTFNTYFENLSPSLNITSYDWNFGDAKSGINNTSTLATPTHTYSDTGIFKITLTIANAKGCQNSDSSWVKIYPGLINNFSYNGNCYFNPFIFTSTGTTPYGNINSYYWNFGDDATLADTASTSPSSYLYNTPGNKNVSLKITTTKGCIDTITQIVKVSDKPFLQLPFKDTLICSIDTLPLQSITQGNVQITWTPNYNIQNSNTNNPYVFPKDTTVYKIKVNDNGCILYDSVTVNVLDYITVNIVPDTNICRTDTFKLYPISQALGYRWVPNTYLDNANIKNPSLSPTNDIRYTVFANLGKCQASANINVHTFAYPTVSAGKDSTICEGWNLKLNGNMVADSFYWTPSTSLVQANLLQPTAVPQKSTNYVLTAKYLSGCLKPVADTVAITVVPKYKINIGNDTSVTVGEPLLLNVKEYNNIPKTYLWEPARYLDSNDIKNPTAVFDNKVDSVILILTTTIYPGCTATDDLKVLVYKVDADIYIPSGFTPNGDGKNDILKPIPIGIKKFDNFSVFNRWGQLLFSTSETGKGWDGTFKGTQQPSGTYVVQAIGTTYKGKQLVKKGTAVLIR